MLIVILFAAEYKGQSKARTLKNEVSRFSWTHRLFGEVDVQFLNLIGFSGFCFVVLASLMVMSFYYINIPLNLIPTSSSMYFIVDAVATEIPCAPFVVRIMNCVVAGYVGLIIIGHVLVWVLVFSPVFFIFPKSLAEMTPYLQISI